MNDDTLKQDWMQKKWRPAMGWMYMIVCICDMVLFPIAWSILQAATNGNVGSQWNPLTLQGAGLFHLAMGAVLGIAAWGRTQEKVNGSANNTVPHPTHSYNSLATRPMSMTRASELDFGDPINRNIRND